MIGSERLFLFLDRAALDSPRFCHNRKLTEKWQESRFTAVR